jgi:antagonist of KipI
MTLRVLDAGLHSLVVDLGRPRHRGLGVALGGAADRFALALGNGLVGNPPDAAALEICLAGPTLRAECDLGCVIQGAPFQAAAAGLPVQPGHTFVLSAGEELEIGSTIVGMRAYVCVRGGLVEREVLGSRSGLTPVRAGQELRCHPGTIRRRFIRTPDWWRERPWLLRAMEGAQAGWFDEKAFFAGWYTVAEHSDRMGLRLAGAPVPGCPREMTSEPVCPGTVQVTHDRQCIILGVDGQTIGGYPKIAQVISSDLDKLGQLRPGDSVRFERVGLDEAERAYERRRARLREWMIRLRETAQ